MESAGTTVSPAAAAATAAAICSPVAVRGSAPRAPARTARAAQPSVESSARITMAGSRPTRSGGSAIGTGNGSPGSRAISTTSASTVSTRSANTPVRPALSSTVKDGCAESRAPSPARTAGAAAVMTTRVTPRGARGREAGRREEAGDHAQGQGVSQASGDQGVDADHSTVASASGPPEFPGASRRSMRIHRGSPESSIATSCTTPSESALDTPRGWPKARTIDPGRSAVE